MLLSTLIEKLDLKRANGDTFTVDEVEKVEIVNPDLFTVEEKLQGDEVTLLIDPEKQEICNQINRRTEFKVIKTTYNLY